MESTLKYEAIIAEARRRDALINATDDDRPGATGNHAWISGPGGVGLLRSEPRSKSYCELSWCPDALPAPLLPGEPARGLEMQNITDQSVEDTRLSIFGSDAYVAPQG